MSGLLLGLALIAPQGTVSVDSLRAIVANVTAAVDAGDAAKARAALLRRPSDRAAGFALATLARLLYEYPEAERRYRQLLAVGHEPRDAVELYALIGRARVHAQRSELSLAQSTLRQAAVAADRLGDRLGAAEAWLAVVPFAARAGGADSGKAAVERAERLLTPADRELVAASRCARLTMGRYGAAAGADSAIAAAIAGARGTGSPRLLGRCYLSASQLLEVLGHQARSRYTLDSAAAELHDRTRDLETQASAHQFATYRAIRYQPVFDHALLAARTALRDGAKSGNRLAVGWTLLNLAQLALRLDDARAASRYVADARRILAEAGDQTAESNILVVEGDAANTLGQLERARAYYQEAADRSTAAGLPNELILFRLVAVLRELGRLDEGSAMLDRAAASAQQRGFSGLVTDQLYERGMFSLRRGRYDEAALLFREFRQKSRGAPLNYIDTDLRLAEALARGGRLDEAEQSLEETLKTVDDLRARFSTRSAQVVALQSRRFEFDPDLGVATMVAEFVRRGRTPAAFRLAEATRSRFLLTQTARRSALGTVSDSVRGRRNPMAPPAISLTDLQRVLPDSTALLELVAGRGGEPTTLFVVTRDKVHAVVLAAGDSLSAEIGRLAAALEGGAWPQPLARRLAAAVIDTAVALLPAGVRRLAIVPDGPFHRLPFDALPLRDGRLLMERFTTSFAPSAQLLAGWLTTSERGAAGRMISVGGARFDPAAKLAALPWSAREAERAAQSATTAEVFLGARASEANLKRADWADVAVLHLATHARVEDYGVMSSALYLSPGDGEDGELTVADVAALPLAADLVVLSACRTLGGDVIGGEGLQGLTAPFIEAGARAVAATYWPIKDRAIGPLVDGFYRGLDGGQSVAEALRQAKLRSRQAGAPPSVWAAFTVTGDGWVRPRLR